MRYISIDLSSDNYLQQPQMFGGYAGEHNETTLQVALPPRMIGVEYSNYRFDFQTSEDNKISLPTSNLKDGILSLSLPEQITVAGKLLFNIVATMLDGNTISLTSKTNMVVLYIGDSPDGNSVLPDPNGYKDEILEMIDARIAEIISNMGGSGVIGEEGATFIPYVSEDSIISWTNNKGLDNPEPVNIKGDTGSSGVYIGTEEPSDNSINVWINPDGDYDADTYIPSYWEIHLKERVVDIRRAIESAGRNKSAFLWYTDSHWTANHNQSPKLLKYLYENTPINKVNFGGDIVQDEPTDDNIDDIIEMSYVYEWRKTIRGLNHHSVVGNHDDGSVVNNRFSEECIYSFLLAPEESNDIVMGDGIYYYIDDKSEKTRYLYLDTAYKMADTQQIEFVINALNTTPDGWHIVAIAHIWHDAMWSEEQGDYIGDYSEAASKFLQLFYLYNHRGSGEISGVVCNFAGCNGKFEFCIGGHTHWDYSSYYNDEILVILTETDSTRERVNITAVEGTITENSVNAIIADYNNNQVSVIRIGRGESRVEELKETTLISYTNVLPTAIDKDGTVFNGCGYKADTRYSNSSGGFIDANGVTCTGLIALTPNTDQIIRLKNVRMNINDTASNVCHCLTFTGQDDSLVYYATSNGENLVAYSNAITDEKGNIIQFTVKAEEAITFMVLNTAYIGADSIITINEPIQ